MSYTSDSHEKLSHLFVLRLARETIDAPWRATLRPADGGDRLVFANIEQLAIFLLDVSGGSTAVRMVELPLADADA